MRTILMLSLHFPHAFFTQYYHLYFVLLSAFFLFNFCLFVVLVIYFLYYVVLTSIEMFLLLDGF